jgi:hypothetical protein
MIEGRHRRTGDIEAYGADGLAERANGFSSRAQAYPDIAFLTPIA